jgi:4-amino-4-deoxy-L-arabinose transferase-like glycosyltransferase
MMSLPERIATGGRVAVAMSFARAGCLPGQGNDRIGPLLNPFFSDEVRMQSSKSPAGMPRTWFLCAVVALFAVFATELYLSARLESQTFDEPAHMYAGYSYWLHSDFGINPEHPPLVKLVATLPLLIERPKYPDPVEIFFRAQSALGGMTMMSAQGADGVLASVRAAVSIFGFVLGLLVVLSAREMFGEGAALLALLLFVFDPLILAHAPLLGTDMGATCCIFGAVFAFYRYVKKPTFVRLGTCCAATGLAFAAKHSAILVFPILAMLCVFELVSARGDGAGGDGVEPKTAIPTGQRALRMAAAYCAIVIAAIVILWAFYGFRYAARPDGKQIVPASASYLKGLHHPMEANTIGFAERHHLLPESYLFGLTDVTMLARDGRPMYLFGKVYPEGKWFYFPAAFVIKMTIGFLILLAMVPFARVLWQKEHRREVVFLLLPPVIFFGSAMSAKVDIGIRHILPIMPFLIVLVAGTALSLARQSRKLAWAVAILVALDVASSLYASPNYLPYSNEAFGGPLKTYRVLADSNAGWGGGLKALHASLTRRGITQCWLAYSALPDPKSFGIPCKPLPTFFSSFVDQNPQPVPEHIDGPVFVSEEELMGSFWGPGALNPFDQFSKLKPSQAIEGEILEFDGSFDVPTITAESEWVIAEDLLQAGKPDQAMPHAQKAAALAPNSLLAHEVLMSVYAAQHQNDAAQREYQVALNLYEAVDPGFQDLVDEPMDPATKH